MLARVPMFAAKMRVRAGRRARRSFSVFGVTSPTRRRRRCKDGAAALAAELASVSGAPMSVAPPPSTFAGRQASRGALFGSTATSSPEPSANGTQGWRLGPERGRDRRASRCARRGRASARWRARPARSQRTCRRRSRGRCCRRLWRRCGRNEQNGRAPREETFAANFASAFIGMSSAVSVWARYATGSLCPPSKSSTAGPRAVMKSKAWMTTFLPSVRLPSRRGPCRLPDFARSSGRGAPRYAERGAPPPPSGERRGGGPILAPAA